MTVYTYQQITSDTGFFGPSVDDDIVSIEIGVTVGELLSLSAVNTTFVNYGVIGQGDAEAGEGGSIIGMLASCSVVNEGKITGFMDDTQGFVNAVILYGDNVDSGDSFTFAVTNNGGIQEMSYNGDGIAIAGYASSTDSNTLNVTNGIAGTIGGDTAIESEDQYFTLINAGSIVGANAAVVTTATSDFVRIENSGTIDGGMNLDGQVRLDNTGTLFGVLKFGDNSQTVFNSGEIVGQVEFGNGAGVLVNRGSIRDDVSFSNGFDTVTNSGSIGGDLGTGDDGCHIVNSGSIDGDVLLGNGANFFNGRNGTVGGTIFGGSGVDKIYLGQGVETVYGGGGHDIIYAGTDSDTFEIGSFNAADEQTIHGFEVAKDVIELQASVFTKLAAGQALHFSIGAHASSSNDHLFYNPTSGVLYYDSDGSGAAHAPLAIATLSKGLALTSANFVSGAFSVS